MRGIRLFTTAHFDPAPSGQTATDAPRHRSLRSLAPIALILAAAALLATALLQPPRAGARPDTRPAVHYCNSHGLPHGCIRVPRAAKRPPAKINQQGGPSLTPSEVADGGGLGGGPGEGRSTAVAWARTQSGSPIWAWRCERFVEEAYGTRYIYATAWAAAQHLALHSGPVTGAPAGTLVFFGPDSANRGFGHVGISLGGGRMISALQSVQITDISRSPYWNSLYRGWAYAPATWPGRLPPPPAPAGPLVSSEVQITAPAFGSTISGVVTLEASAANVGGVAFEAYYESEPGNPGTLAWHLLGDGTLQSGSWALDWNASAVPAQGDPHLGTVNLAAVALNAAGELTGTRDYRRINIEGGAGPGGVGTTTTVTPPPPTTYAETTGGEAHTWSNYANAGGTQGPTIGGYATVQIACAITGFAVADGNTWWYKIASTPWNDQFYVSADAFYNNGSTSGTLKGTPFVDTAVPPC